MSHLSALSVPVSLFILSCALMYDNLIKTVLETQAQRRNR